MDRRRMSAAQVSSSSAEARRTLEVTVAEELLRLRGVDVEPCTECGACSEVCPVVFAMDVPPAELITRLKGGAGEDVLVHVSPWLCTDCRRCSESCPLDIDVARAMEALRLLAQQTAQAPDDNPIVRFHEAFLEEIAQRGRLHELSLLWRFRHQVPGWRSRPGLIMMLLGKGKLSFRGGRCRRWPGPKALHTGGSAPEPDEGEGR